MCQTIAGVAVLTGDMIKVFTSSKTDSHTEIRKEFNIRDDNSPIALRQTPVELIPIESLIDVSGMKFVFDDQKPDWWTDSMTDEAIRQLYQALKNRWENNVLNFQGSLFLQSLTSIPEGVTLNVGDNLFLYNLTSIPKGVTLNVGGDLYLSGLTSIPKGVTVKADYIYFKNNKQMRINNNEYLYRRDTSDSRWGIMLKRALKAGAISKNTKEILKDINK